MYSATRDSFKQLGKWPMASNMWLIAFWSFVVPINLIPTFGLRPTTVGYLWYAESALAGFLLLVLFVSLVSRGKGSKFALFGRDETFAIILPILMFTVWSGLSVIWAMNVRNAMHHTLLWACYLLSYLLIRQIVRKPHLLSVSLTATGIVALILSLNCVAEYIYSVKPVTIAFTIRWYEYAEALATLLPVFLALSFSRKKKTAFFFIVVVIGAWLLVFLSLSRTMMIASIVSTALFFGLLFLFHGVRRNLKKAAVMTVLLIVFGAFTQISFTPESTTTFKRLTVEDYGSTNTRVLLWGIALEVFRMHPIIGVGGDNYISAYKIGRESYSAVDRELLSLNENQIPERVHNEYLQILSELGMIGAAFFLFFIVGIIYMFFGGRKTKLSILALGAYAGVAAFLISSISSSYSFRIPANGLCFFFVLALAVGLSSGKLKRPVSRMSMGVPVAGVIVCIALLMFSAARAVSLAYVRQGMKADDVGTSLKFLESALSIDREDPMIRAYYGNRLSRSRRYDEAVRHLRFSIDNGLATVVQFFRIYDAQMKRGSNPAAERSLTEGLRVFPRSVFLRTAYVAHLRRENKAVEAETEYSTAVSIDPKQAKSWQLVHDQGIDQLEKTASEDKTFAAPAELLPSGVTAALATLQ